MKKSVTYYALFMLYFALTVSMYYFSTEYFALGINVLYKIIFAVAVTAVSFAVFLVSTDLHRAEILVKYILLLILPYLFSIFISLPLWAVNMQSSSVIRRGIADQMYMIFMVTAMAGILYVFGKRGIWLNLAAMLTANGIVVLRIIIQSSFFEFFHDLAVMLSSFTINTSGLMDQAEIHELTFGIGAYLLYFIIDRKSVRKNRYLPIAAILSVCFFITGLKRIAVFAFAGALSVYLIFRVFNGLNRSFWVVLAAVLVMAFGFLYIVLMGAGLYDFLSDKLGINTMGRQELVREYSSYYELSPIFVGKGSGYISKLFSELPDTASVKSIQCDFLLIYIDLGFWGYWAWMALYLPVRIWLITRWQGGGEWDPGDVLQRVRLPDSHDGQHHIYDVFRCRRQRADYRKSDRY